MLVEKWRQLYLNNNKKYKKINRVDGELRLRGQGSVWEVGSLHCRIHIGALSVSLSVPVSLSSLISANAEQWSSLGRTAGDDSEKDK